MLTYISIITLDNPYLLLGCDKFTHYREYSPSKFRYIAISVKYLLYFRCDREYHFAGTLVSFTCFVPKKTQLFAASSIIQLVIGQSKRIGKILPSPKYIKRNNPRSRNIACFSLPRNNSLPSLSFASSAFQKS